MTDKIFDGPEHIEDANTPCNSKVRGDFHITVFKDKYPCTPGHMLFVPQYNTIGLLKDAFEDALDVPTINRILEVCGGIKMDDPNLLAAAVLAGQN
mgnify:CR=1 FL=1